MRRVYPPGPRPPEALEPNILPRIPLSPEDLDDDPDDPDDPDDADPVLLFAFMLTVALCPFRLLSLL